MTPSVLVTGGNRGLGLGFVRHFLEAGWEVTATCRDPATADGLQALAGSRLAVVAADVTDPCARAALVRHLGEHPLDLLINNAGVAGPRGAFGQTDLAAWRQVMEVNVLAPLALMEALAPALERGTRRQVVAITSRMGSIADNGSGGNYAYRSSKAALNMVVRSAAIDLRPRGFTVVALHPGWVRTDMGGPDALIDVEESVSRMGRVIAALTPADSGRFIDHEGRDIPW